MSKEKYYLLSDDEDGISIEQFDNEEGLTEYLNKYYLEDEALVRFMDRVPETWDGYFEIEDRNCDTRHLIILKGKVLLPKAVEIVKAYKIEDEED